MRFLAKALFISFFIFSFLKAESAEIVPVGKILKTKDGNVNINRGWERKVVKAKKDITLYDHDSVSTDQTSKAYIKLIDGSKLFLDKKSNIMIRSNIEIRQKFGDVQYDIKKRRKKMQLQIITDFAKINVVGTKFRLITTKDSQRIILKEGMLNLELKTSQMLYSQDSRCGENYVKEVRSVNIKSGERLTFLNGRIVKECGKSETLTESKEPGIKEIKDAITLLYKPFKGKHQCGAISKTFSSAKSEPIFKALEDGCELTVEAEYEKCIVISDSNVQDVPYSKEGTLFKYTLKPVQKEKSAFVQYQCRK